MSAQRFSCRWGSHHMAPKSTTSLEKNSQGTSSGRTASSFETPGPQMKVRSLWPHSCSFRMTVVG